MAVHPGRRTADALAAPVVGLPDGLAARGSPELCRALARGCQWASVGAMELWAARRAQQQPDA
jgi:hypothetical protein